MPARARRVLREQGSLPHGAGSCLLRFSLLGGVEGEGSARTMRHTDFLFPRGLYTGASGYCTRPKKKARIVRPVSASTCRSTRWCGAPATTTLSRSWRDRICSLPRCQSESTLCTSSFFTCGTRPCLSLACRRGKCCACEDSCERLHTSRTTSCISCHVYVRHKHPHMRAGTDRARSQHLILFAPPSRPSPPSRRQTPHGNPPPPKHRAVPDVRGASKCGSGGRHRAGLLAPSR